MLSETNPMRTIKIAKLSINTCVRPREGKVENAASVLKQLTGQTPFKSKSRLTIRGWGIRRNEEIATSVTIRGEKAFELLENALKVKEFKLPKSCFSNNGCFGFGISEHIDLNIKYDPNCGIFGLNYYVVLERPGSRISKRRRCKSRVGQGQRVSGDEAQKWFVDNFEGVLLE